MAGLFGQKQNPRTAQMFANMSAGQRFGEARGNAVNADNARKRQGMMDERQFAMDDLTRQYRHAQMEKLNRPDYRAPTGAEALWEERTKGLSPEDKEKAIRQSLYLDAKPIAEYEDIKMIGDVPYKWNRLSSRMEPVEVQGQEITAETVGEHQATIAGMTEAEKAEIKREAKVTAEAPDAYNLMNAGIAAAQNITDSVTVMKEHKGRKAATGGSAVLPSIPGGEAADFERLAETLQAGTALNSLINAKNNGATFGALSESELQLLKDEIANLSLIQSEDQYLSQLNKIEQRMSGIQGRIKSAFKAKYGDWEPEGGVPQQEAAPSTVIRYDAQGNRING